MRACASYVRCVFRAVPASCAGVTLVILLFRPRVVKYCNQLKNVCRYKRCIVQGVWCSKAGLTA